MLMRASRNTEMDITMIGLQNAGKTSLLRVLAVSPQSYPSLLFIPSVNTGDDVSK